MKIKLILLLLITLSLSQLLIAQEKYQLTQLTKQSGQTGFFDWSPDGKKIMVANESGLYKIALNTGIPKQISTIQSQHPSWSPDGEYIVFDADLGTTIKQIPSDGGESVLIVPDTIPIINSGYPLWSPDGLMILFQGRSLNLYLLEVKSAKITQVAKFDSMIPVPKSWSPDGKHFLVSMRDKPKREANLWLISRDGGKKQLTFEGKKGYANGHFSPDGSVIVYTTYKTRKVCVMPTQGGKSLQLTFTPDARDSDPKFSSDGQTIAFRRKLNGIETMWLLKINMEEIKKELKLINSVKS